MMPTRRVRTHTTTEPHAHHALSLTSSSGVPGEVAGPNDALRVGVERDGGTVGPDMSFLLLSGSAQLGKTHEDNQTTDLQESGDESTPSLSERVIF